MKRFTYTIDGHLYFLNPEYKVGGTGRVWLTGCEMYNREGDFVGYWYRHNMPVNLITEITKHVKLHRSQEPVEKQAIRGYTRRTPKRLR